MKKIFILLFLSCIHNLFITAQEIPSPEEYFGFKPGTDKMLLPYDSLITYLQLIESYSSRVEIRKIGKSPMGKPMYIAFISSPENINNLDKLKSINKRLAIDAGIPQSEKEDLIDKGKVFVLGTLSMHSTEVGPSQSAPLVAYDLLTTKDPEKLGWLNKVVYMMVPNHNPDGMDMVISHYNKYKETKYEGSSMPGIYHKYVGHDNNRDFVTLSQDDTKAIGAIYNTKWYPQVMVEKHQMGMTGPRYFVPPPHDPIAENIDAEIWSWIGLFGANMMNDMNKEGLEGVSQHYLFDDYWPGATETCLWKNIIGMLTECASVKIASPVYIEPGELKVYGKGLSEYKKSINMPDPWEGGWWRLSDIVEYEVSTTMSILKTAARNDKEILKFRNDICIQEVNRGNTIPPFYYVLTLDQHDKSELVLLTRLLNEHGVRVYQLTEDVFLDGTKYKTGDIIIPLAQPYRPFIKEVLEKQKFPLRRYTPGGEIIKPYDITSWSLPLHRGIKIKEINNKPGILDKKIQEIDSSFSFYREKPSDYAGLLFNAAYNESYKVVFWCHKNNIKVYRTMDTIRMHKQLYPTGSFLVERSKKNEDKLKSLVGELLVTPLFLDELPEISRYQLNIPKIALVETYFHDMDAGWTRFLFDSYLIPFTVLPPESLKESLDDFNLIIFPDNNKSLLVEGKYKSSSNYYVTNYPPEYTRGMEKEGLKNLTRFINKGGKVIAWGRSSALLEGPLEFTNENDEKEEFQFPFEDISDELKKKGLYIPGSFVQLNLTNNTPLTYGMEANTGIFYRGEPVFTTRIPSFDMDRRVIGSFPETNILMSGYAENEKQIGKKAGMIWMKKGKGQVILFAFNPQFRASTPATYKLLFNAILLHENNYLNNIE